MNHLICVSVARTIFCMSNLWERQQNKRAKAKKAQAKGRRSSFCDEGDSFVTKANHIPGTIAGLLTSIHRNRFDVLCHGASRSVPLARGIDPHVVRSLAVGDIVFLSEGEHGEMELCNRGSRHSSIVRLRRDWTRLSSFGEDHVLAANVDVGVITVSLKSPDFHPRFIDRYLAILQIGHVHPLICLTKTDLCSTRHPVLDFYRRIHIPIVETSLLENRGIERLASYIHGKIAVFLGQSGVGKSSIISRLLPDINVRVGSVEEKTGKGRHTTTTSSLYCWNPDSYIIDTPGIRSLSVEQIPKEDIRFFFREFLDIADHCRFSNCLHLHEPGCAIKEALDEQPPRINAYRYESYRRMMEE